MLVIVSDLHLSDESTSANVHEKALSKVLLRETLQNVKANAKEIRVVLLGDIFDLVRTDYWVKEVPHNERPWNGKLSPANGMNTDREVERHYQEVLERILSTRTSKALFRMLSSLRNRSGKGKQRRLYTKITFVTGNHDRALSIFPSLRRKIEARIDNVNEVEFLTGLFAPEYGVLARHGHEWDDQCFGYKFYKRVLNKRARVGRFDDVCYGVQTIGEVVTAELMSGLIYRVKESLARSDPALVQQLMELNNVRPQIDVFGWLEWFGRTSLDPEKKEMLLQALRESISAVLKTDFARKWDKLISELWILKGDLTDRLEQLLKFIEHKTFDELKEDVRLFEFFQGVFGSSKDDFVEGARREWDFGLPADIQYVVYGHTHEARNDFFSGLPDHRVRMYINTGTYLPLIQRARDNGFATAHQMTMTFFYRKDEDTGGKSGDLPSMELWNGIKRKVYDR